MKNFPGKIGRTVEQSEPFWPTPPEASAMPPNVITIVFDDSGWSDFGCFGSEIKTPNIDAVAMDGLRYSNFNVTPMCSPTRASFLTGRNHHCVGMRTLSDSDTGFPNARGAIHQNVPTLPELLRKDGYGTYMIGKWHLAPSHECTPAGPYKNWPVNRGFDRFYGFLNGCTDHYCPELVEDNHTIDPPLHETYHLSEDMCEKSIKILRDHAAFRKQSAFFLNFCLGATHAPIQVEKKYIDPYVPVFECGWDKIRENRLKRQKDLGLLPENTDLVPPNPEVSSWDTLNDDQKRLFTRLQAAYAGFLQHADEQIGKLLDELKRLDLYENTIILIFSDNGASPEGRMNGAVDINSNYSGTPENVADMVGRLEDIGGVYGPAHYPQGWAMAGNTPFRRYKQFVELGGVRSPLVMSWPMGIKAKGEVRDQFLHVIDLAPTIMDLAGDRRAANFDGESFRETLTTADAPAPRNLQYWEMFGRRAIYHNGWKAVSEHEKGDDYSADNWRLYDTGTDASECHDLANIHRKKLQELQDLWWQEAEANDVFPLDDRTLIDIIRFRQPNGLMSENLITLYGGQSHLSVAAMICGTDRSLELSAHIRDKIGEAEGVLISTGNRAGGYSLYVKDGQLTFEHIHLGKKTKVSAALSGDCQRCGVTLLLSPDSPNSRARVLLRADDREIGHGLIEKTASHLSFWGLDVGRDAAMPVTDAYMAPFLFPEDKLDRITLKFIDDIDAVATASRLCSSE